MSEIFISHRDIGDENQYREMMFSDLEYFFEVVDIDNLMFKKIGVVPKAYKVSHRDRFGVYLRKIEEVSELEEISKNFLIFIKKQNEGKLFI